MELICTDGFFNFLREHMRNIYCVFIALLVSCAPSEVEQKGVYESKNLDLKTLSKGNPLVLKMDSLTTNNTNLIQLVSQTQGFEQIAIFNRNTSSIDLYRPNADTIEIYKRLRWPAGGPHAMRSVSAFYYLNEDSIYLFDGPLNTIALYNGNFEKITELIGMDLPNSQEHDVLSFTGSWYKPVYFDSIFYLMGMSYHHKNISPKKYFESFARNLLKVNLSRESIEYTLKYPSSYQEGKFYPIEYEYKSMSGTHLNNESVLVSFPADPDLYLVEKGVEKLKIRSEQFFDEKLSPWAEYNNLDRTLSAEFLWSNPVYAMIAYDKFNKVYYRITYPKSKVPDEAIGKFAWKFLRDFVITVYNTDFDIIATKTVSYKEKLLPRMYFISKKGLYIHKDVGDEDLMVFEPFQLDLK